MKLSTGVNSSACGLGGGDGVLSAVMVGGGVVDQCSDRPCGGTSVRLPVSALADRIAVDFGLECLAGRRVYRRDPSPGDA